MACMVDWRPGYQTGKFISSGRGNHLGVWKAVSFARKSFTVYAIATDTETKLKEPLGKKFFGKPAVQWVAQGMAAMAAEIANAEANGNTEYIESKFGSDDGLLEIAQSYLDMNQPFEGFEDSCARAREHFPTLYDHLQRELQRSLINLEKQGVLTNWQQTYAWKFIKRQAKSGLSSIEFFFCDLILLCSERRQSNTTYEVLDASEQKLSEIQKKVDDFVKYYLELLTIEKNVEVAATREALGDHVSSSVSNDSDALRDMLAVSASKGSKGMDVVTFRSKERRHLPTILSPGDMLCIRKEGMDTKECIQGTLYKLSADGISIEVEINASSKISRFFGAVIRIDRIPGLANTITYERNCEALRRLQKYGLTKVHPAVAVTSVLFGDNVHLPEKDSAISFGSNDTFDETQKKAISFGLDKRRPVVVIQGPPGTGKTSVVTDIIVKSVAREERVLVTAPTNAAVDNLVEKFGSSGLKIVRLGNPMRMASSVTSNSLSFMVDSALQKSKKKIAEVQRTLKQNRGNSKEATHRKRLKELKSSAQNEAETTAKQILSSAQVVLCTNIGAGDPLMKKIRPFDLAIVDEAGQAIEPACWIPILQSKRLVLAGDTCQLAPTILSKEALEGGLGISLMERASRLHDGRLSTMLQVQYRMHSSIASWASAEIYGGILKSASKVSSTLLSDLQNVKATWRTRVPLLLLDTRQTFGSLADGCEECRIHGSYYNDGEADIVVEHVLALIEAGVPETSIVVETPYVAQVELIRERMVDAKVHVQVESVDSFQGREADAVIISMVRSNNIGDVGFLADRRRMNVAVTRARNHVTIVCDSSTLSSNKFLKRLLQHIRVYGETRSTQPGSPYMPHVASISAEEFSI